MVRNYFNCETAMCMLGLIVLATKQIMPIPVPYGDVNLQGIPQSIDPRPQWRGEGTRAHLFGKKWKKLRGLIFFSIWPPLPPIQETKWLVLLCRVYKHPVRKLDGTEKFFPIKILSVCKRACSYKADIDPGLWLTGVCEASPVTPDQSFQIVIDLSG